jgi:predicted Zn-dependent protease
MEKVLIRKYYSGIILVLLFIAGCATVPITGRKQLSLVSQSQMLSLGQNNFYQILKEEKLSRNQQKIDMLNRVGVKIALSAEEFMRDNNMHQQISEYNWRFVLIENDESINAFCLPGGKIGVYTGILDYTQDETGLAVVIAHEVAHAIANHGGERMSQMLLVQLGGTTLASAIKEKPRETQSYFLLAYGIGANLGYMLPYSRIQEYEADRIGLIIMARAGYDPREAVNLWQRLNRSKDARPPEFLSTHPAPASRIESIRRQIPTAMKYYNSITK